MREIREYSGGDEDLENEVVWIAQRVERAIGQPETMVEALCLFGWLVHEVIKFDDLLRNPVLESIGYRKAAAIVASVSERFGLTRQEMLRSYHRSPLQGPDFDRAEKDLRDKFERAGIAVRDDSPKSKKRRRGKGAKGTNG